MLNNYSTYKTYVMPRYFHVRIGAKGRGRVRGCDIYRAVCSGFGKIEPFDDDPEPP